MGLGNLGIGLAAALGSFRQGMQTGQSLRGLWNESETRDQMRSGMERATADRQNALNGLVSVTGGGESGQPEAFQVGNRSFANRAEADAEAGRYVGGVMDFFNQRYAPSIYENYVRNGDMEGAERWNSHVNNAMTQSAVRTFGEANRLRAMGDEAGAVRLLMRVGQAAPGNEGRNVTGVQPLTNDQGQRSGYRVMFTGPDGQTGTHDVQGGLDGLFAETWNWAGPQATFDYLRQRQTAASDLQGRLALERLRQSGQTDRALLGIAGTDRRTGFVQDRTDARQQRGFENESARDDRRAETQRDRDNFRSANPPPRGGQTQADREQSQRNTAARTIRNQLQNDQGTEGYRFRAMPPAQQEELIRGRVDTIFRSARPGGGSAPTGGQGPAAPRRPPSLLDPETGAAAPVPGRTPREPPAQLDPGGDGGARAPVPATQDALQNELRGLGVITDPRTGVTYPQF